MADGEVLRLLFMCLSIIGGIALQTFGIIRYIIGRQDAGDNQLHKRINEVERSSVRRGDYERDMDRLYTEIGEVRDDIKNGHTSTTSRLDTLIFAMTGKDVAKG